MIATATTTVLAVTTFPAEYAPKAHDLVLKANRRAARAGIAPRFDYTSSTAEVVTVTDGIETVEHVTTFVVLGEPLRVEGWEFVATITWDSETGAAVTRVVPGVEVDLSNHRDAKVCEHCGVERQRTNTYVVRHADGTTKQVGSSCLAAFLGIDITQALWVVGEDWSGNLERETSGPTTEARLGLVSLVALALAATKTYGWVSATKAREDYSLTATSHRIADAVWGPTPTGRDAASIEADRRALRALAVTLEDEAKTVVTYIRSSLFTGSGEYVVNLKAAFLGETVSRSNLALAASSVACWVRFTERAAEDARKAAAPVQTSTHVGAVKERLTLDVTVTGVRYIEGQYGTTTLLSLVDATGNVFKWFASNAPEALEEVGATATITGTVKAHDTFRDVAQTVLTRCKAV